MSYLALARKWRPGFFSEVVGQEHVVSALSNALNNQRVHHAFLFTGTRGVGKTTLARIFAKALNCESGISAQPCGRCTACQSVDRGNFMDLIEVDAASRTKVDDTRELLDNVQYTPTTGRFKIYLIDEVHMLSTHSFNALLKTLEEPPEHVKFLLATTNPRKLPTTILSRCIQFNLKSVDVDRLSRHLEHILKSENIHYESQALPILSRSANGSIRDSLSLLDQAIAYSNGDISSQRVKGMLGMIDDQLIEQLLEKILDNDASGVFDAINQMSEKTADYGMALDELMSLIHNISLFQFSPESLQWKGLDSQAIGALAEKADAEILQLLYQIALNGKRDFEFSSDPRSGFEMIAMRMLAFWPGSASSSAHAVKRNKPAGNSSVAGDKNTGSAESAPAAENIQALEPAAARAAQPAARDRPPDIGEIVTVDGWHNFISQSGLGGIQREILMNMSPRELAGKVLSVTLESSGRHLFNDERKRKIETYFKEELALDIALNVEIADLSSTVPENETPKQKIERERKEKEASAKKTFIGDDNVQSLIDAFDAEIVSGSIKSGSG